MWFGAPVTVSGSPSLALTIGSNRRRAAYRGCGGRRPADPASGCRELQFTYEVQAGDRDLDGISVGRDALSANGAEIRDAANPGVAAVLSIGAAAVTNDPAQRVDGAGGLPRIFGVRLLGPERGGDTHRAEGVIYVLVSLTESVQVSHGADLTLAIEIGSTIRHARLVMPGEVLDFRYTVQPGDYDPDGISIRADALTIRAGGYARDFRRQRPRPHHSPERRHRQRPQQQGRRLPLTPAGADAPRGPMEARSGLAFVEAAARRSRSRLPAGGCRPALITHAHAAYHTCLKCLSHMPGR